MSAKMERNFGIVAMVQYIIVKTRPTLRYLVLALA